jgi:hypothetical protein
MYCIEKKNKIHLSFNDSYFGIHLFEKISKFRSQALPYVESHNHTFSVI